jgi:hypothetical protein
VTERQYFLYVIKKVRKITFEGDSKGVWLVLQNREVETLWLITYCMIFFFFFFFFVKR